MQETYTATAPQPKIQGAKQHRNNPLNDCVKRTIDQELFLACIQTYTKVTHNPVNPAHLAQQKFPTKMRNAVLNKDARDLM